MARRDRGLYSIQLEWGVGGDLSVNPKSIRPAILWFNKRIPNFTLPGVRVRAKVKILPAVTGEEAIRK